MLICSTALTGWCQTDRITGTIKSTSGEPLGGATVLEKNTKRSAKSDASGNFAIDVSGANAVLSISYVGYQNTEVKLAGGSTIAVVLQSTGNNNLNDVVVIGYGTTKRKDHRGRTRQYYLPNLGGQGAEWGTTERNLLYGRSNSRTFRPTKYLLTTIFEPKETTPDTRFKETFTYKFYASVDKTITAAVATAYKKDASVVGKIILNTVNKLTGPITTQDMEEEKNMANDAGLAIFTPNWTIDPDIKKKMPMLVSDPSDLFSPVTGNYKASSEIPTTDPNLTTFSRRLKVLQKCGCIPINIGRGICLSSGWAIFIWWQQRLPCWKTTINKRRLITSTFCASARL